MSAYYKLSKAGRAVLTFHLFYFYLFFAKNLIKFLAVWFYFHLAIMAGVILGG